MSENKTLKLSLEIEKLKDKEPKDTFGIVYMLFAFLGVIHFIPATFFITAHDYWMYKFRNTSFSEIDSEHRTLLQKEFSPSLTISLQLSSVASLFLTLFLGHKFTLKLRLFGPLSMILIFFVISAAFIHIDTDAWQTGFFILTIFIVAIINSMSSVFGMAVFTVLAKFPNEFLGAYLNGQGMAAIFTSCLQVLSLAVGISTEKSALLYFWLVIAMIIFCLGLIIAVSRENKFYKYNAQKEEEIKKEKRMSFREIIEALKIIWPSLTILLFFLITVNPVHTSITSLVVSEGEGNGEWNDVYFVPVTTFVLPAFCEMAGRIAALKFKIDVSGVWFAAFSAIRVFIFVPLLMLCNAQPREHLPVVFHHDYQYILIMIAFTFTNGYLVNTGNLIIPRTVPPEKLENAYHVNIVGAGVLFGLLCFLSFISVGFL